MRIAIYHNLISGGAKRALFEWTKRLSAVHHIGVYSLSTADHAFRDIRPFVKTYHIYDFSPHKLTERKLWGRLNRLQRWRDLGQLTKIGRRIAKEINSGGYDVVFAQPCLYTLIPIFLRYIQIPAIYYLHEPFGPNFQRQFVRPYLKPNTKWREISKRFDPFVALFNHRLENARLESIKNTTLLLANSRFTQRQMKVQYNANAPVCYYGASIEDFQPKPGIAKENYLISVGELAPRKGFDFLIESLTHLSQSERPTLRIVSNWVIPDERKYIKDLAARYNIELQILVGLTTDQLTLEYNKAKLCVYTPVQEPLGLVPLEAMACGTPVVGVREGGVRETVVHGKTGLLTERNPQRFAEAVQTLLNDTACRMQFGLQGREYVAKEWQWDSSVQTLEKHLASVI